MRPDLGQIHTSLSGLVKMYQFRSRDEQLYYGVTVAQAYCLRALWLEGRMSMKQLADDLGVSVSTMTGVVDQLVKKKFIARKACPKDRRVIHIDLTAVGREVYEKSNDEFLEHLGQAVARYKDAELRAIDDFLVNMTETIADWREKGRLLADPQGGAERHSG